MNFMDHGKPKAQPVHWLGFKDPVCQGAARQAALPPSSYCSSVDFREMTGPQQVPVFKAAASVFLG